MKIRGRVWVFGDNIDTDVIIPGRYLVLSDPEELAKHVMEGVDPDFSKKVKKGDIIVAGRNFGCGSSREHAVIALKYAGISAIIAESFARIFFRNAINLGLPVIICPGIRGLVKNGDEVEIDLVKGKIKLPGAKELSFEPLPPEIMDIIRAGGLINYLKLKLMQKK